MPSALPLVPGLDPVPLPGPPWLFTTMLMLFFFLHIVFISFMLGGGIIALYTVVRARLRPTDEFSDAGRQMVFWLPIVTAIAVNFGVATLLFVQAFYGLFFFTSSILIAWPWFSVVGILILVYYGYYAGFYGHHCRGPWIPIIQAFSVAGFAFIAFVFVNNVTLMMDPERWAALYAAGADVWRLNLGEQTLLPRYLHLVNGMVAVGGLGTVILGMYDLYHGRANPPLSPPAGGGQGGVRPYGSWKLRYGVRWIVAATLVQYALGVWFVLALPPGLRAFLLHGGSFATIALVAAITLSLVALGLFLWAAYAQRPFLPAIGGVVCLLGTVAFMVIIRQMLRHAALEPYLAQRQMPVETQGWAIFIFASAFVGGVVAVGYCVLKLLERGGVHEPA